MAVAMWSMACVCSHRPLLSLGRPPHLWFYKAVPWMQVVQETESGAGDDEDETGEDPVGSAMHTVADAARVRKAEPRAEARRAAGTCRVPVCVCMRLRGTGTVLAAQPACSVLADVISSCRRVLPCSRPHMLWRVWWTRPTTVSLDAAELLAFRCPMGPGCLPGTCGPHTCVWAGKHVMDLHAWALTLQCWCMRLRVQTSAGRALR
jgi:hypothetical protein